jgi:hypothetical protein
MFICYYLVQAWGKHCASCNDILLVNSRKASLLRQPIKSMFVIIYVKTPIQNVKIQTTTSVIRKGVQKIIAE